MRARTCFDRPELLLHQIDPSGVLELERVPKGKSMQVLAILWTGTIGLREEKLASYWPAGGA